MTNGGAAKPIEFSFCAGTFGAFYNPADRIVATETIAGAAARMLLAGISQNSIR